MRSEQERNGAAGAENFISIIVPARNGARNLDACLRSIANSMNSSALHIELIVVNNNSSDATQAVIEKHAAKDSRIHAIFEPKIGRGAARHTGELAAQGNIILCTDSDCTVPENWIAEMTQPIREGLSMAVQGYECATDTDNYWSREQQIRFDERWNAATSDGSDLSAASLKSGFIDTKNFAIKADLLRSVGGMDPELGALIDTDLYLRLTRARRVVKTNNPEIEYVKNAPVRHAHPNSPFSTMRKNAARGYWAAKLVKKHGHEMSNKEKASLCMTVKSFTLFYPGLITLPFKRGFRYALFNSVVGKAWRVGIIASKLGF